jgi:serine/threonine-protein kinase
MSLAACERRDPAWALRILTDITAGLVAIHDAGIVHRDLKPANVLVSRGGVAKIADFGVSTFDPLAAGELSTLDHLTATGAIVGTPGYMAPELLRGVRAVGFAVDLYAFGVLAYHLLGGHTPFASGVLRLDDHDAPPSLGKLAPSLPRELTELVDACLAIDPAARPTSAHVLAALRALPALSDVALPVRPRPPTAPTLARGCEEELPTRRAHFIDDHTASAKRP